MIEQLKERFKAFETELNGAGKGPWHDLRVDAFNNFESQGFPSVKNEEYRYTHLGRILQKNIDFSKTASYNKEFEKTQKPLFHDADAIHIYVNNGVVDQELLEEVQVEGLEITTLKEAITNSTEEVVAHLGRYAKASNDPFTALNTAFSLEGVFIKVLKNVLIEKPILIHYTSSANPASSSVQSRNLIIVGQSAKVNIVESYSSESEVQMFRNHVSEVVVGANAFVNYYKLQNQNKATYLIDNTYISQQRDSKVQSFTVSLEGKIIRNNLNFSLEDENIEAHMFGLYVAHEDSHIDNHTSVDHKVANCYSNEIYKGILDDNSKGIFNGKIFVRPDAQKTNAFQSNKNILLSDTATINTKPQLEIWADDVSCSHGCTTGQLDEESLFYLRSRGIGESKAKAMLLHAFVNDVVDKIEIDFLHDFINDEMYNRLD